MVDDINLLPEELKKEEQKIGHHGNSLSRPVNLYRPNEVSIQNLASKSPLPVASPKPAETAPVKAPVAMHEIKKAETPLAGQTADRPVQPRPEKPIAESAKDFSNQRHYDRLDKEIADKQNQPKSKSFLAGLFGKRGKGKIIKTELDKTKIGPLSDKDLDVNLIPEGSNLLSNSKLYLHIAKKAGLAVIVLAAAYGLLVILGFVFKQQDLTLAAELETAKQRFGQLEQKNRQTADWQKQLASIDQLFKGHVYWTKVFKTLEETTLPQVYYKNVQATADGIISLTASADSYLSVARQYLVFQSRTDLVNAVEISSISGNPEEGGVNFDIILALKPELFLNEQTQQ